MDRGQHVVWLDYEGGAVPTARRLLAVGAKLPAVREFFHYAGWPTDAEKHMNLLADRWPGALVVIDSASKALHTAGKDENSPGEVTAWTTPVVRVAKLRSLPVVVIDHVTKNAKDGRYARGAGAKLADTDVHWLVDAIEFFDRQTVGTLHLRNKKDREGYLPHNLWFTVGDGNGRLPIVPTSGPPQDPNEPTL